MPKFRKKPVVIPDIWISDDGWMWGTLEGPRQITFNDWIIKDVKDEIYPCKPDIFAKTYEPVKETADVQ